MDNLLLALMELIERGNRAAAREFALQWACICGDASLEALLLETAEAL